MLCSAAVSRPAKSDLFYRPTATTGNDRSSIPASELRRELDDRGCTIEGAGQPDVVAKMSQAPSAACGALRD